MIYFPGVIGGGYESDIGKKNYLKIKFLLILILS